MDVTSHLGASLDAAVALANRAGAAERRGRRVEPGGAAERREAVREALRLATRTPPALDEAVLDELAGCGVRLYAAFEWLAAGDHDGAAERVNALLAGSGAAPRLTRHDGEPWHLRFAAPDGSGADAWIADLATAVAMLLGSDAADRLRRCAAERCGEFFLDAPRGRPRVFCSTACQNRTKVAAFRAREGRAASG